LDDWSEDESDDSDIDWQTEQAALGLAGQVGDDGLEQIAQVSEQWLVEEFKINPSIEGVESR